MGLLDHRDTSTSHRYSVYQLDISRQIEEKGVRVILDYRGSSRLHLRSRHLSLSLTSSHYLTAWTVVSFVYRQLPRENENSAPDP